MESGLFKLMWVPPYHTLSIKYYIVTSFVTLDARGASSLF